jgi:NAD dependent epimerase/dehydratase
MKLNNQVVLVTGATGFIGSHLVEELLDIGVTVKALAHYNGRGDLGHLNRMRGKFHDRLEIIMGDIRDPFFCNRISSNVDIVFHLAALIGIPYSYIAPAEYIATNLSGTLNILEASRVNKNIKKIIHTSTSETYGTAKYTPINEDHPLQGQSPYSASKISADKLVESYFASFNTPVTTIRPFNTYGPRQSDRAIIPTVMSQISAGSNVITIGSLDPVRDFTFVKDTVQGFIKIAESDESIGRVINIGNGKGITIGELVDVIQNINGTNLEIVTDNTRIRPKKSEVFELIADNAEAKKLIGWEPKITLLEGLTETNEYVMSNISNFNTKTYNI